MRVIAGRFRGRRLGTVRDLSVRPVTDRVKQTVFDTLGARMAFEGAEVLDLFAGSGSLGIEALSRGAASAVFVEVQREAAASLRANLALVGCGAEARVVEMDAVRFAETHDGAYDLVFADPPYAFEGTAGLPGLLFGRGLVRAGGLLSIEHAAGTAFPPSALYREGPVKKFGRTFVTFFRAAAGAETGADTDERRPSAAEGDPS